MSSPNTTPTPSTPTPPSTKPSTSLIRSPRYYMLTAFTNRLLPLALFTILLITGTVILIYTVVDKKVLPPRYIVASYITIAVIVGLWCALRMILFLRRQFGGMRTDDPERGLRIGIEGQGGSGIDAINRLWGKKERRVKKCLKWLKETGMLLGKFSARNHRIGNGDGTESESSQNDIAIANSSNTSQADHPIQTPQPAHKAIPLRDFPPPTTPDPPFLIISPLQITDPSLPIPANTHVRPSRPRSYPVDAGLNHLSQIHTAVHLSSHKRTRVTRSRDVRGFGGIGVGFWRRGLVYVFGGYGITVGNLLGLGNWGLWLVFVCVEI
ncbi:e76b87bc-3ee1-4047-9bd6-c5298ff7b26c-CDS [Sclerotinia trifoliorum]|uniref:E76b87bc-3ee1-4047-9bd6-c5298ff7b26c-CDS n=1 Tax=Sclerotinia trifoliorum TaxID=28548 RepID=A0A8H2W3M1_9HELO|nr:e76b87bc-3ee1-4047-9bd6-c5298ff7b26c-CDS [Sclerotinia trifoliorum]